MDILKWIFKWIPEDPDPTGGFYAFRLPKSCEWMNDVLEYHDRWYRDGPKIGMKLSDIDWRIYKALTIRIEQEMDLIKRCHMAEQVCWVFPIMRKVGRKLYGRSRTEMELELPPL